MERYAFTGLFLVFLCISLKDLLLSDVKSGSAEDGDASNAVKKKSYANLRHTFTGPSYRRVFEEYSYILRQKYPDLSISGDNFNPPAYKLHFAQFLGIAKLVLIALILANINPFSHLGYATPSFWLWLTDHKIYGCLMTFFVSNMIEGQMMSTGAFEIFYNDIPIWSKLETNRIPSPPELFQIIDNYRSLKADSTLY